MTSHEFYDLMMANAVSSQVQCTAAEMVSTQLPGIHNEDILLAIFSYLPIVDLASCAAVCKQWHEVVKGCTQIWKGKRYTSNRRLMMSAEMRAILFALPLLHKAEVKEGTEYYVNLSYPCLSLSDCVICDMRAVREWQKIRCSYLSVHLNIAEFCFSSHSPIDFSALQKLKITNYIRVGTPIKPGTRAECAISSALQLCPNLRELSISVDSLSADYLGTLEGMSHLRTLKINCYSLKNLEFLRHCSDVLEELKLAARLDVPSAAYAVFGCLGKLQRLQLHRFHIEEGDLEVAARGLRSLVSLELSDCDIPDVSFLRHCGRLREVIINVGYLDRLPTGLPASVRSLSLYADELTEALPPLPSLDQLSFYSDQLDRLDFLRGCPQLRRLCLDYLSCPDKSELLNLRHLSQLETLEMPGFSADLAFLSSVIPSLPQLDTLTVVYRRNFDYEGLLKNFPRFRSLSLFDNDGNLCDMSQLGWNDLARRQCNYVCKFFRKVV